MSNRFIMLIAAIALVAAAEAVGTVNLGTAANYVILAKTGITTTGVTAIKGNIGISPAAATAMTGFGLILDSGGTFSTSSVVSAPGKIYAANYASPTPSILTTAVGDMETAYTDAAGRPPPNTLNLGGGALNGQVISAGLYTWTTPVSVGGTVTINGGSGDIWIFQIPGTLTFNSGSQILLTGGAKCEHVFWQVAGQITFGSTSATKGIFLGKTGAVFNSGATLSCGRVLAQTAVTMIGNSITKP